MRVEETITINAPREDVWEVITDPECYTRTLVGISRFDVEGPRQRGLGARYSMRMHVGSAEVGGLVEVVEFDSPRDMAWTSVMGLDHRVRWRLREQEDGTTKVTFRLSYQSPGTLLGTIADYVSSPMVDNNLRESLERLKAEIEGEGPMAENDSPGLLEKARLMVGQGAHTVKTLAEAGGIKAERPHKTGRAPLQIPPRGDTPPAGHGPQPARHADGRAVLDGLRRRLRRQRVALRERRRDHRRARPPHVRRRARPHEPARERLVRRRHRRGRLDRRDVPQPPLLHRVRGGRFEDGRELPAPQHGV